MFIECGILNNRRNIVDMISIQNEKLRSEVFASIYSGFGCNDPIEAITVIVYGDLLEMLASKNEAAHSTDISPV